MSPAAEYDVGESSNQVAVGVYHTQLTVYWKCWENASFFHWSLTVEFPNKPAIFM